MAGFDDRRGKFQFQFPAEVMRRRTAEHGAFGQIESRLAFQRQQHRRRRNTAGLQELNAVIVRFILRRTQFITERFLGPCQRRAFGSDDAIRDSRQTQGAVEHPRSLWTAENQIRCREVVIRFEDDAQE